MANPIPGTTTTLSLQFYNQESGILSDPTSIQLDITTGGNVGLVTDTDGPYFYLGSSTPNSSQVYRTGTGLYSLIWNIPANLMAGSYTANWSVVYQGDTFLITENFYIGSAASGYVPPSISVCGYWTGSLSFQPSWASSPNIVSLGGTDTDGIQWYWEKLDGWDGADVSGSVVQRASDHGGWPTEQFYAPRTMTWNILAIAPSQYLRDVARCKLNSAMPVNSLATFTYNEPIPKQAMVRRSGRIAEVYANLNEVEFSVVMVAPDPRKYSSVLHSQVGTFGNNITPVGITVPFTVPWSAPAAVPAGAVQVNNYGDFETRPVITITGPITNPQIINATTGRAVTWGSLTLGASDQLVIDMDLKQAILNGNAIRPADFTSSWWVLNPGISLLELGGSTSGGATMTVAWRDAWI